MDNPKINVNSEDEIVIVVPKDVDEDELVIDLDELGIDIEQLGDEVNIVIQVEGDDELESDFITDEDFILEPNEWYFDDDPYGIVYYEFPEEWQVGLMDKEIPYYVLDENGQIGSINEPYIDDGDLKELLLSILGDDIPQEEIQKILDASADEKLTEDEFDKLVDEFILKNKK